MSKCRMLQIDCCISWNENSNAITIMIVTIAILEMASIAQYCIAMVSTWLTQNPNLYQTFDPISWHFPLIYNVSWTNISANTEPSVIVSLSHFKIISSPLIWPLFVRKGFIILLKIFLYTFLYKGHIFVWQNKHPGRYLKHPAEFIR